MERERERKKERERERERGGEGEREREIDRPLPYSCHTLTQSPRGGTRHWSDILPK